MELVEKLNILNFSDKEKDKTVAKFFPTLYLVDDDLAEKISYLNENGVNITHARELKVLCVSKEKLAEAFRVIGEVEETEMFVEDPVRLCFNPIDIYRKIKYCKSNNMSYRNEDGSYKEFLFSEIAWKKELEEAKTIAEPEPISINDFVTLEPETTLHFEPINPVKKETTDNVINFADFPKKEEPVSMYDEPHVSDSKIDIELPPIPNKEKREDDLDASIAQTRKELAAQLSSALATLKDLKNDDLTFDQIEPDMSIGGR
jgi:hypothetical protein